MIDYTLQGLIDEFSKHAETFDRQQEILNQSLAKEETPLEYFNLSRALAVLAIEIKILKDRFSELNPETTLNDVWHRMNKISQQEDHET